MADGALADDAKLSRAEKTQQDSVRVVEPPAGKTANPADASNETERPKRFGFLRRHPLWVAIGAIAIAALAVAGYFFWLVRIHPFESTDDAFVDARSFTVSPKVTGFVVDAPVGDNQHVETGAVLFQIDRRDYEVALDLAQAQQEAAEAAVVNADAQIDQQKSQIEVAEAQVTQAQATLQFAEQDAARYKELAQKGAGSVQREESTRSTLQQQQAALTQAQANLGSAQKQVKALQAQKASASAQLDQAKARVAQARLDLSYTTVTAAQPGRLVQLTGSKGQFAQAGAGLATFVPDEIWVTANFKETQVTDMRPGQPVDVVIDAYPDHKIRGHVDSVQPGSGVAFSLLPAENATGNYVKVVQRIPVKIVVDRWPTDVAIGPGMSIVPTVQVR
ncbi:HlyD family secretion protein [Hansschlegelia plantiphila]|uniref:Hemolysin secretion protein D n=1 Tax=Hansschlegelia plantiphila TaxID=374655 RepID=A0A9W6J3K8_9HYPH|nr:HlyD family secretion protein [Hansschlegelia plantiphila]GLK69697.1 hemolysin secretion protein D [Hansschlegelia plantiphila]